MSESKEPQLKISRKVILIGAAILIVYMSIKPTLEERFGWELPDFVEQPNVAQNDNENRSVQDESSRQKTSSEPELSDFNDIIETDETKPAVVEMPNVVRNDEPKPDQPALGLLKELSGKVYVSTAGLKYTPGSVDKHRLMHVMQHAEDNMEKPVHGVFNVEKKQILVLLDEAWELTKERGPPQVRKSEERGRTVYIVDMKKPVGYVGGQSGKRRNNPTCNKIQLVVEGDEVITAYPTQ